MNNIQELITKYPEMLGTLYCGIECNQGWYKLLDELLGKIQAHTTDNSEAPIQVFQIKEKFGGLRFYYSGGDNYIAGLVQLAEHESEKTCEVCSAPGTMRTDGWMKVRCDDCMENEDV